MDKGGTDVVPLHGRPQSCMPNPVECLLEVYEDIAEVLLVLEIFLAKDSSAEDLLCSAPSCCEACLFFSDDHLRLRLQYYSRGESCKLLTCHSWEGFQHIRIFELFEVKLESCNLLTLFRRRWKVISSKSSAPRKLCVMAMFTPVRKRFLTKM